MLDIIRVVLRIGHPLDRDGALLCSAMYIAALRDIRARRTPAEHDRRRARDFCWTLALRQKLRDR